jgi:hypothetical protein
MLARTVVLLAVFAFVPGARADDTTDAEAKLKEYLAGIKGSEAGQVKTLTEDGMKETFPDHVVFSHVIRQYPIARPAPAPLKHANVIAIPKKEGKPILVTDTKLLEKFFKDHARPVKTADEADAAIKAWVRATAELNQDGFYKFTVKTDGKTKVDGATVTGSGQAPVDPQGGNKGAVSATLTFKEGKLATAETKVDLKPGVRPICQATKLLDPDPIVRGMAEQSIRVMGSAAKPYLDEQRARAPRQLREAIDRVWAQIVAEGR